MGLLPFQPKGISMTLNLSTEPHFGYLHPPTDWLVAYVNCLATRLPDAPIVERVEIALPGWRPQRHACHDNACIWADANPGYSVVRGWLHFPLPGARWSRFVAHSVVSDAQGKLIEVTPTPLPPIYRFVPADLSDDEYREVELQLIKSFGAAELDCWHGETSPIVPEVRGSGVTSLTEQE